jgi:hypothetical protein
MKAVPPKISQLPNILLSVIDFGADQREKRGCFPQIRLKCLTKWERHSLRIKSNKS